MIKSLSIIYPVYNEEKRLRFIFSDIIKFNKKTNFINKEYIFVDDGSNDNSKKILEKFIKKNRKKKIVYRLKSYKNNRGKGYALKIGILNATKNWILTSDSDCSVSNLQLIEWINKSYISQKYKIYFGSRNNILSKVKKKRYREIIGNIFRLIILLLFNIRSSDTQCGFKLYKLNTARKIFRKIKTEGYLHDLEIYIIAKKFKLNIKELPVTWIHKSNGKINVFKDGFKIIFSIFKIKYTKY